MVESGVMTAKRASINLKYWPMNWLVILPASSRATYAYMTGVSKSESVANTSLSPGVFIGAYCGTTPSLLFTYSLTTFNVAFLVESLSIAFSPSSKSLEPYLSIL